MRAMWEDLHGCTESIIYPGHKPVRKPTNAMLDRFENRWKFTLPKSYRQFILMFGPGELAKSFRIAAPGYTRYGDQADLELMNNHGPHSYIQAGVPLKDPEQVVRTVFFSYSIGNEYIGWDSADITNRRTHEYGIYILWRDDNKMTKIAGTFAEFIEKIVIGPGIKKVRLKYFKEDTKYFEPEQFLID